MEYQETSGAAWRNFYPDSAIIDAQILAALEKAKVDELPGLSDLAIEQSLGVKHQTVSANRRHLVEKGWVTDSGYRQNESGYDRILWRLTDQTEPKNPEAKPNIDITIEVTDGQIVAVYHTDDNDKRSMVYRDVYH